MSNQYQNDVEVDLRSVFGAVARALPWLILVALVIGAAVFALLSMSDPSYRAETMVLIETGESELTRPADAAETAALLDQQGIASQVQLVRSRDVALAVIEQLNLAALPEFDPGQQEPSLIDRLTGLIGLGGDDDTAFPITELVLAEFMSRLTVSPVTATRVIAISFVSEDPQLAADVANAVAAQYIAAQREVARSTTAVASEWLQREIEALSARVVEAERNVEDFRAQNDLFRAGGENNITITAQRLADASAELQRVRAQATEAESKAQLIRASLESGRPLSTLDVLNSALVQRLREQEVLLRSQIAEAAATLLPTHPRLRELNAQLADVEGAIREEARNILAGLETEAALARGYEVQLAANQRELQIAAAASNQAEVQLRALERVATAERQLLETYLGLAREAVSRQNADYLPVNARIISSAAAPVEPFYPKPIPMAVVGVVITLMLGAAIILVRELASGRATRPTFYQPIQIVPVTATAAPQPAMSPSRMPPRAGAPPASTAMPPVDFAALEAEASSPALADPEPPVVAGPVEAHGIEGADERQMIAPELDEAALAAEVEPSLAAIAGEIRQKNARRVLITMVEGTAERGRPLAAVALSRALARSGQRILLVDLHDDDADRLAMGEPESLPGFAELAAGNASFAQVIFRDRVSAAHFIPSGQGADAQAMIDSGRLATLSAVLDQTYDHVVYDIGGELIPVLGPAAGAIVLVSDVGPSDRRTIEAYAAIRAATPADVMLLVTEAPPEPTPTSGAREGAAA